MKTMEPLVNMNLIRNEVTVKRNNIPDGEYKICPRFTRNIKMLSTTTGQMDLITEINNTDDQPFPLDIKVSMTGVFDLSNLDNTQYDSFLKINAVQIVFPYLRNLISSVTASALMPPIILPIIDVVKLFSSGEKDN